MSPPLEKTTDPQIQLFFFRKGFGDLAACETCPHALACLADTLPRKFYQDVALRIPQNAEETPLGFYFLPCVREGQVGVQSAEVLSLVHTINQGWLISSSPLQAGVKNDKSAEEPPSSAGFWMSTVFKVNSP